MRLRNMELRKERAQLTRRVAKLEVKNRALQAQVKDMD